MKNVICYFLCFLVESVILWQYASHLFIPAHTLKQRLTLLLSLYAILFTVSLFDIKWLNMGLYILANFFFLFTQYRLRCHSAIFHSAILAAVMGMCELIVYSVVGHFTPYFFSQAGYFYNKLLFIIFSKILFFSVICILTHFLKGQKHCSQFYNNSMLLLVFIPFTAIFIMLTFVSISDSCILTPAQDWMFSLSAVFLLTANLFVFGINQYNQKKHSEFTEMQLLLQKETDSTEYYKMLLAQNENQSILIHDIKKHLQSIELLNERKDHVKINEYIRQLMLSSDLREISRTCDHELLNAILSRYKRQCNEKRVSFLTDIRSETTDFIADNDLTSLFCNLLDNALEAAGNVQNSFIEINIRKREKTPFVVITVINSCRVTPYTAQSGNLITNKPNRHKHGFGLKSIRKIDSKYNGDIQMYYNNETLTFHTIIILKHSV